MIPVIQSPTEDISNITGVKDTLSYMYNKFVMFLICKINHPLIQEHLTVYNKTMSISATEI